MGKRRVTRYNDTVGPDFSSGMIVLTIFIAAVIVLSVYFVCNREVDPFETETKAPVTETDEEGNVIIVDTEEGEDTEEETTAEDRFDTVYVSSSDVSRGFLILVNNSTVYDFDIEEEIVFLYQHEEKSKSYGLATVNISCAHSVLSHLNAFMDDYYEATEDNKVVINSGHRTYDDQNSILQNRIDSVGEEEAYKYVAIPGYSEHHTGYALDIASYGDNYDPAWMPANCWRYGFIQRYQADKVHLTGISYEYWHYRYVGAPHAEIMYDENLCMEEYIELIDTATAEAPYYYMTDGGEIYMIYSAPVSESEQTPIEIPKGAEYVISGNNAGGFIVTAKLDSADGIDGVINGADTEESN